MHIDVNAISQPILNTRTHACIVYKHAFKIENYQMCFVRSCQIMSVLFLYVTYTFSNAIYICLTVWARIFPAFCQSPWLYMQNVLKSSTNKIFDTTDHELVSTFQPKINYTCMPVKTGMLLQVICEEVVTGMLIMLWSWYWNVLALFVPSCGDNSGKSWYHNVSKLLQQQ